MRVSPDPWHPGENEIPQAEARPQRSEWMRFLLYAAVFLLIHLGSNLLLSQATQAVINHSDRITGSLGSALYRISIAGMFGSALLEVTVSKWLVFRSRQRWWVCLPLMLAGGVVWRVAAALIQNTLIAVISDPADALMIISDVSSFLSLVEIFLFYAYQRFVIFRTTLDTL